MVPGNVIMAYYAAWSIYGPKYNVWDMDATKISHINYAFGNIENGLVVLGDSYADVEQVNAGKGDSWNDPTDTLHGNFHQLFRLKQKNRHLKVGLSIGGWTWSGQFSVIAQSERARKKFVASAIQFLLHYGFDYIDLDWEYPGGEGLEGNKVSPSDLRNFVLLLEEFDTQIKQNFPAEKGRPYVTIAAACTPKVYKKYLLKDMAKYLKYFNMMCYDFTGPWSPVADHQSNLFNRITARVEGADDDDIEFCTDDAINYFIANGVDPKQIVLGVPIYGREFAACPGILHPFHGTGKGSWEPGMYDYKALPPAGYNSFWERTTNATFIFNQKTKSLITYDDARVVAFKMDYILKKGLAGVMFWEMSADKPTSDKKSLLRTMDDWIGGTKLDRTENMMCYPKSRYRNIRNNPICPAPSTKDDEDVPGAMESDRSERFAQIMQYCLKLLGVGQVRSNKAHSVPSSIDRLRDCYNDLVKELL